MKHHPMVLDNLVSNVCWHHLIQIKLEYLDQISLILEALRCAVQNTSFCMSKSVAKG